MQRLDAATAAPEGYQAVLGLERYVRQNVEPRLLHLVKLRASMLNACTFCVDMHAREALEAGESSRRLFALAAWRESPFFEERERAALALTGAVTRLGEHGVPDDVWNDAAKLWSERELTDLVIAIATINVWNRIAISIRMTPPDLG